MSRLCVCSVGLIRSGPTELLFAHARGDVSDEHLFLMGCLVNYFERGVDRRALATLDQEEAVWVEVVFPRGGALCVDDLVEDAGILYAVGSLWDTDDCIRRHVESRLPEGQQQGAVAKAHLGTCLAMYGNQRGVSILNSDIGRIGHCVGCRSILCS